MRRIHIFVSLFLVVAVVAGLYANKQVTQLFPKAAERFGTVLPQNLFGQKQPVASVPKLTVVKTHFAPGENIRLTYEGQDDAPFTVQLKNTVTGGLVDTQGKIKNRGTKYFDIQLPKNTTPGVYKLTVKSGQSVVANADLTLGALVTNVNKSYYLPQESVSAHTVEFNTKGVPVCDTNLYLQAVNTTKAVSDKFKADSQGLCTNLNPIHEATFKTGDNGTYIINSQSGKGPSATLASLDVLPAVPVSIARQSPTLIRPEASYDVKITLTASQDFEGIVSELIPSSFDIKESSSSFTLRSPTKIVEDASTLKVRLPVEEAVTPSLAFGEEPDDPELNADYRAFEVKAHDGIDFPIVEGTSVVAVDKGKVIEYPKKLADYGNTVVIQHSWGRSFYGHLSRVNVSVGDVVDKGEEIGLSGSTGLSTGPHLHFGIEPKNSDVNNGYLGKVDPALYFAKTNNFDESSKRLEWSVSLRKGETTELGYTFSAPKENDTYYLSGPITLTDRSGQVVFEQSNRWTFVVLRR